MSLDEVEFPVPDDMGPLNPLYSEIDCSKLFREVTIPYTYKDYLEKIKAEQNKKPSAKRKTIAAKDDNE